MTTHLAETSVLTRLSVAAVRGAVQPFIDAVALARCTLTDLELGFAASSASDWDRLQAVLTTLNSVEVTPVVISRAKNVQRMLAAGGLKGRKVPDLIIAAAAELAGLTVLHYDHDFELIASVTGQHHEWVVPRGSIDLRGKCRRCFGWKIWSTTSAPIVITGRSSRRLPPVTGWLTSFGDGGAGGVPPGAGVVPVAVQFEHGVHDVLEAAAFVDDAAEVAQVLLAVEPGG